MKPRGFERRWFATIGRTVLPAGALGGVTAGRDLGGELGRQLARMPWTAALMLRAAIWVAWLTPLLTLRRPRTFGGLGEAAREAHLVALLESPRYAVREGMLVLKLAVCFAALGHREALARLGAYDLGRVGPREPGRPDAAARDAAARAAS